MNYSELINLFISHLEIAGRRPATLAGYREVAKHLAAPDEPVAVLTPARTRERVTAARRAGSSDSLIHHIYGLARRLGAFAIEQGALAQSPVAGVPQPRKPSKRREPATQAQLIALLNACSNSAWPQRDLAILLLLGRAGLRVGELVGATISALDLDGRWLRIDAEISKSRRDRSARFDLETAAALRSWLDVRPAAATDLIFISHSKRRPLTTNGIRLLLRRLCDAANIHRVTPHQLRHLFATELADSGLNMPALMALAGWSDTRTAMIYIHSSQAATGNAFDRARGIKATLVPAITVADAVADVPAPRVPTADELAEVLRQCRGNVSAAGRFWDVAEATVRGWVRDRGLVPLLTNLRREAENATRDGLGKAEFAKVIVEANGSWSAVGRALGCTASGARQRAERLGLSDLAAAMRSAVGQPAAEAERNEKRIALANDLRSYNGNISRMAAVYGITPRAMQERLATYDLLDLASDLRQAAAEAERNEKRIALAEAISAAGGNFERMAEQAGISPKTAWGRAKALGLLDHARAIRLAAKSSQ